MKKFTHSSYCAGLIFIKKKHVPGPPQHTKESIGRSVQLTEENWTHGNGWTHLPKPRFIGRQQKGPLSLVHPLQASCHC